ncbi:MAG: TorF family putative porin [Nitrosomonas sp.]|nr:TorF family putative porin [Nitrosomonas sp.]
MNKAIHNLPLLLLFALLFFSTAVCHAELSASVTGSTDYFWRGYSKSDKKPFVQANIDYEFKTGFYLGSYFSSVNFADHDFANRSKLEFRPYFGYAHRLSKDWRFNVEWNRYLYDGNIFGRHADYNEFYFLTHFRDLLTVALAFSENSYNQKHMSFSYEMTGRYPITDLIEFSSTFGYNKQKKNLHYDYVYWTSGFTMHFSRNIGIDLRYYGSTHAATKAVLPQDWQFEPDGVGNRVLFSITFGF